MAIALDTSATSSANSNSPYTYSYTVTGSNCFLVVGLELDSSATVSAVTYNSVAMTQAATASPSATLNLYLFYLPNAPTGTHTVSATISANANVAHLTASYTGCATTGQPDNTGNDSQTTNPTTVSITTTAASCWIAGMCRDANDDVITLNSGGTVRQSQGTHTRLFDTNAAVSAGSNSFQIDHQFSGQALKTLLVSFAPVAGGGGGGTLWAQSLL